MKKKFIIIYKNLATREPFQVPSADVSFIPQLHVAKAPRYSSRRRHVLNWWRDVLRMSAVHAYPIVDSASHSAKATWQETLDILLQLCVQYSLQRQRICIDRAICLQERSESQRRSHCSNGQLPLSYRRKVTITSEAFTQNGGSVSGGPVARADCGEWVSVAELTMKKSSLFTHVKYIYHMCSALDSLSLFLH